MTYCGFECIILGDDEVVVGVNKLKVALENIDLNAPPWRRGAADFCDHNRNKFFVELATD